MQAIAAIQGLRTRARSVIEMLLPDKNRPIAFLPQDFADSRAAVFSSPFGIEPPDLLCQHFIAGSSRTAWPLPPRIIPAPSQIQQPAHPANIPTIPMRLHELIPHFPFLEKNARAFFKISLSSFASSSSRRSRRSSSSCGPNRPFPGNASPPKADSRVSSRFHRYRTFPSIPRSRAASRTLRPPLTTRLTASILNCRSYDFRCLSPSRRVESSTMPVLLDAIYWLFSLSTKWGKAHASSVECKRYKLCGRLPSYGEDYCFWR